ncbi:MAG: cell division protein FtsQ/DivIB [bacterium]
MKKIFKISSIIFLLAMTALIFYLSFQIEDRNEIQITVIEMSGNNYLGKDEYFKYAHLLDKSLYKFLSLPILKDRMKKHPYVDDVDVQNDGNGKVTIILTEKKFNAILLHNNSDYLMSDNFELLPVLPFTKLVDLPIITNPEELHDLKLFTSLKRNADILTGFKILDSMNLLNPGLFNGVTEIDFRNGGDITLSFSFFDFPVIIGRKNEIKKTSYFTKLWNSLEGKEELTSIRYIDLRFNGNIFIGFPEPQIEEDKNL